MRFTLRSSDLQDIIYQRELPADFATESTIEESGFEIRYDKYLKGEFREIWFDGVHIIYGKAFVNRDLRLKVDDDMPVVEMHFALSGYKSTTLSDSRKNVLIEPGMHNLFYMPYFDGYFESYEQKSDCSMLEIHLSERYFKRIIEGKSGMLDHFMEKMEKRKMALMGEQNRYISAEMYHVIHEMFHCNRTGLFKRFFLESRILELLMLQIEQYQETPVVDLKQEDIHKVHYVKSLLEENYGESLSLEALARKSGLNEFKLKKGFKSVFGTTVFGYLRDLRLEEAKIQLLSGNMSIEEVAHYCGYRNPQYFTTAFRKKFGITPGKYKI